MTQPVKEQEAKLWALRQHIQKALDYGGSYSDNEIAQDLTSDSK